MSSARRHSRHDAAHLRGHAGDTPDLFGAYVTRVMLGFVGALALLVLLFRLPFYTPPTYVDWRHGIRTEENQLTPAALEMLARAAPETPITRFDTAQETQEDGKGEDEEAAAQEVLTATERPRIDRSVRKAPVLDFSEEMPEIVGGLGAYYIHIEYPAAARHLGIEGRLILDFIVEPDGRTTDIRVLQSLHPLCDSAAVQALRQTYFMPGRQNGEKVRVRMRLPVRFQLVDRPGTKQARAREESAAEPQS